MGKRVHEEKFDTAMLPRIRKLTLNALEYLASEDRFESAKEKR